MTPIAYCGLPPAPGEWLSRFNLDPVLICVLLALACLHLRFARGSSTLARAAIGWLIAAFALISPLCALSVSLFSARIAQHMLLLLVCAPLIAIALPAPPAASARHTVWIWAASFWTVLWFWHMPVPYDFTFRSTAVYWLMHVSLFGSGVFLWRELLLHRANHALSVLMAGLITTMQMGLLGALLTLGSHPLFSAHLLTTYSWGLTPLEDQQLGGTIMWVPGIALFLWAALRSMRRLWSALDGANVA